MDLEEIWKAIVAFQGYSFETAKGLKFSYTVRGKEIFFDRKEKSITFSTVAAAYQKVLEMDEGTGIPIAVPGPKKLGCFGASYLYPVFIRIGVIREPRQGENVKETMRRKEMDGK